MARDEGSMNTSPLSGLVAEWRNEADTLRKFGATGQAEAVECCATGLEERLRASQIEALTLEQAATESGFSYSTLQQRLADGSLPNAGERGSPRIRRVDLPLRGGAPAPRTEDGTPDLASEVLGRRLAS